MRLDDRTEGQLLKDGRRFERECRARWGVSKVRSPWEHLGDTGMPKDYWFWQGSLDCRIEDRAMHLLCDCPNEYEDTPHFYNCLCPCHLRESFYLMKAGHLGRGRDGKPHFQTFAHGRREQTCDKRTIRNE
jgi:hypothetical protein